MQSADRPASSSMPVTGMAVPKGAGKMMDAPAIGCHTALVPLAGTRESEEVLSATSGPLTAPVQDPFRPSAHTGLLLAAIRAHADTCGHDAALDMGVGSGVVLAVLGQVGMRRLFGVDIDQAALDATSGMLHRHGMLDRTTLLQGSLWQPLGGERFDMVAANLPQFAADEPADPDHTPFWSSAGDDGRRFMDPFLAELGAHLRSDGVALIAHNVFLGITRTETLLRAQGLACRTIAETSVLLHPVKAGLLSPQLRERGPEVGIHRVGTYDFIDVEVLEIRHSGTV
jgi:release factor glutamine methyltransferase